MVRQISIAVYRENDYTRPQSSRSELYLTVEACLTELSTKKEAYQILFRQFGLVVMLASIVLFISGFQAACSVLLGGLAYWLPTLLFVWRVFTQVSVRFAKQFVIRFFAGEVFKLLLSAVLFVWVINYFPIKLLFVVIGFVGAVVAFWIASLSLIMR